MVTKKILFFYSASKRSVAIETSILAVQNLGHEVVFLSTSPKGQIHSFLESKNVTAFSLKECGYLSQIIRLIRFCSRENINIVFSHLQQPNFVAVLAGKIMKSKVIAFRHHFNTYTAEGNIITNRNEILLDKIINKFATLIVVPSHGVYNAIINKEKIKKEKLMIIPYLYDFSTYPHPDPEKVKEIKKNHSCNLRLIMVSRMVKLKQHNIVFKVLKELISEGFSIKLLVFDEGPERESLENFVSENNLSEDIIFFGYRDDLINFMAASDLLIQPSLSDASNSVAKEMAILEKAIAVSSEVGDYEDYVKDQENSFLIPLTNRTVNLKNIILDAYTHQEKLKEMGKLLKKEVISKFDLRSSTNTAIKLYETLLM